MQNKLGTHRTNNGEKGQARGDAAYIKYVRSPSAGQTKSVFRSMCPRVSGSKANDAFVEAIKGVRRMPRYQEAKKDVSGCEKNRRAAKKALTR